MAGFPIIDLSRGMNKAGLFGGFADDEPRINSDAMPTDTWTRLQDLNAGMVIGQLDELPNIDIKFVADNGEFVGKSNVDISERVFSQLAHLGCSGVGRDTFSLDKRFIKRCGPLRATLRHSANNSIVADKLMYNLSRKYSFRTIGYIDISLITDLMRKSQITPRFG
jgi:hypothetical protein